MKENNCIKHAIYIKKVSGEKGEEEERGMQVDVSNYNGEVHF